MARRGAYRASQPSSGRGSSSSDSDDGFEKFLSRMRTPRSIMCFTPRTRKSSSKENFFRYLTDKYGSAEKDPWPARTSKDPGIVGKETRCSPLTCSDDEDSVFVHGPQRAAPQRAGCSIPPASSQSGSAASVDGTESSIQESQRRFMEGRAQSQRQSSSEVIVLESSDDEMDGLIVRLKQRMLFPEDKIAGNEPSTPEQKNIKPSLESLSPVVKRADSLLSASRTPAAGMPSSETSKSKALSDITRSCRMQMRRLCTVQGCFLQELSDPESQQSKHFRSEKEELAQSLYSLYNHSVFEGKLPERMEIIWNKKMQKTAGCCVTGQQKAPEGQRYAKIMLSEKVCDSADRLRDTLIHELCHAATWLIHGIQGGHGGFWSFYAKKSAVIHPELPVVSRCHNYEINYKFSYECLQCKNTIGRHSKSLDTQRFVCALCKGQLVLCQSKLKDGTPAKAPLAPFAKYVKENYGATKRSQQGLSHGAVMKKLSADFAARSHFPSP